jgi:hypothetical protein
MAPAMTSAAASQARLTLIRTRPVTVDGAGFKDRERVALTLRSPRGEDAVKARAGQDGTLHAKFSADVDVRCTGFSISATGKDGSRARFIRRPPLSCTP